MSFRVKLTKAKRLGLAAQAQWRPAFFVRILLGISLGFAIFVVAVEWHRISAILKTNLWNAPEEIRKLALPSDKERVEALFPELTQEELSALKPSETETETSHDVTVADAEFQRTLRSRFKDNRRLAPLTSEQRYIGGTTKAIVTDSQLPKPRLSIEASATPYPVLRLEGQFPTNALFYFEIDTKPTFDSPNFWRHPTLNSQILEHDVANRSGFRFKLFRTSLRDVKSLGPTLRFPFRVTAMALQFDWPEINFERLAKFSQLAGYGLTADDLIREVFWINVYRNARSSEIVHRSPLETFAAGAGECSHVNQITGEMLEINGLRYRSVSGFDPLVRVARPGSGHTAIEVYRPGVGWEYIDPFLSIYAANVAAQELAHRPIGQTIVSVFGAPRGTKQPDQPLTLGRLFTYRVYSDEARRLGAATMVRLAGKEVAYGRSWSLRKLRVSEKLDLDHDLPDETKIYVRGRYVTTNCTFAEHNPCQDRGARASEWAENSFTIYPKALLRTSPSVVSPPF